MKYSVWILAAGLMVSVCVNIFLVVNQRVADTSDDLSLLNPHIAMLEVDEFRKVQNQYNGRLGPLKKDIENLVGERNISVYYEDLRRGSWLSVNGEETFVPGSLTKLVTMIAVLKKIEADQLAFNSTVILQDQLKDNRFGKLWQETSGEEYMVRLLLEKTAIDSDNTANRMLRSTLDPGDISQAFLSTGMSINLKIVNNRTLVRTKDISNIFRSLYYSTYLSRPSSQYILSLLTKTSFDTGMVQGVPNSVPVAHKIGFWHQNREQHDCAIIYKKREPYVLCIFSSGLTSEEFTTVSQQISESVFNFLDS